MKQQMPPDVPLAIVIFAAVTAVALLAVARRPSVTVGLPDPGGHGMVAPPGPTGDGPENSLGQMQYVFHELHADGHHALCAVCNIQ